MDLLLEPEEIRNETFKNDIFTLCDRLTGQLEPQFFRAQQGFVACALKIIDEATILDVRQAIVEYFTDGGLRIVESFAFCGRTVIVIPLLD